MRLGQRRIQLKRLRRVALCNRKRLGWSSITQVAQCRIAIRQPGIGGRKPRFKVNRSLEALYPSLQSILRSLVPIVATLKIGAVCVRVLGQRSSGLLALLGKLDSQLARAALQLERHRRVSRLDRNNKAITACWYGLDRLFSVASAAHGLAESGNVHGQVYFLDNGAGPHRTEQIVFADQMPAAANESDEQIERLGGQRDRFSMAQQEALLGSQNEVIKLENLTSVARIARA